MILIVLLVGVLCLRPEDEDHPFAQMYYPFDDKWVVIEKDPDERPFLHCLGMLLSKRKAKRLFKLFTYNVDTGSWGILWDGEFGQYYHTCTLVGRIYYVLHVCCPDSVPLCDYDLESEKSTCFPVTILVEEKKKNKNKVEKEWVPFPTGYQLPIPKLFSVGDSKMVIVWHTWCFNRSSGYNSVHWSTFEMIDERTGDGDELKLFARPLTNICYHINDFGEEFNCFVLVFPSDRVRQASPPTRGGKGKETCCQD